MNKGRINWDEQIPKEYEDNPIDYFRIPDDDEEILSVDLPKAYERIKYKLLKD